MLWKDCYRWLVLLTAHHSGSGRMASPFPVGDLHLLSFASFPGAHRFGSFADMPSLRRHVCFTPASGHQSQRPPSPL